MLIKFYYLLQNSLKNLLRTKGIISIFILSFLIGTITFFNFNLFLFFHHIHQEMVISLENETDFIAVQMGMAPAIGMLVFKIAVFILFFLLILLTIGYIKKSFKQLLITQQENFKIMALLGESPSQLGLFYTCQVLFFSIVGFFLSSLSGSIIFNLSVIKTAKLAINSDAINNFQLNLIWLVITVFSALLYIGVTTFLMANKKISSNAFHS